MDDGRVPAGCSVVISPWTSSVLWLLTGCWGTPSAGLGELSVRELTMEGAEADLRVEIDNPWPVGTTVQTSWELAVRDHVVAHGEAAPTELAASGPTSLQVPVAFTWAALWQAAGGAGEATPYRATLSVTGDTPMGPWTLPIVHEGELPGVRLPTVEALGVRVDELSLARIRVTLLLDLDVAIDALRWTLRVGTQDLVHGSVERAEGQVLLPASLELARSLEAARTLLGSGIGAELTGSLPTPMGVLPLEYQRRWDVAAALGLAPRPAAP